MVADTSLDIKHYKYVGHLDHAGRIADSPSDKKQKAATALLRDAIQERDFFYRSLLVPPKSSDRSADTSWLKSFR